MVAPLNPSTAAANTAQLANIAPDARLNSLTAPAEISTLEWRFASGAEREQMLARLPVRQSSPAQPTPEQLNGQPLGTLTDSQADAFWIGETGDTVRRAYNPQLTPMGEVPPIQPDPGFTRTGGSVVFVNGLNNDQGAAANAAQLIANKTGGDVRLFYNATQGPNDVPRGVGDNLNWLGISRTPAARQLASTIATSAANGQSLHIVSTSHGSILMRNALYIAQEQLLAQNGYREINFPGWEHQFNREGYFQQLETNRQAIATTSQQLGNIRIETMGAAAARWDIGGPQYVHWVNQNDRVAALAGINFQGLAPRVDTINAGSNSVIIRFTEGPTDLIGSLTTSHSLETYLPKRTSFGSFDQVYNQYSSGNGSMSIVDIPQ